MQPGRKLDCSAETRLLVSVQYLTLSNTIFSKSLEGVAKSEISRVCAHQGTPAFSLFNVSILANFHTSGYLYSRRHVLKQFAKQFI